VPGQSALPLAMVDERVQEVDALSDHPVASFIVDRASDEHISVGCSCNVVPSFRGFDVYYCCTNTYG
jgi:hypothetical protein